MKNLKRLVATFILPVCMMVISAPALALDSNVSDLAEQNTVNLNVQSPRSFSRKYTGVYISSFGFREIMSDTNWWGERTVTVTIDKLSKNTSILFECFVKTSSGGSSIKTIRRSLDNPTGKFDLPADAEFSIEAMADEAVNADIIISLS